MKKCLMIFSSLAIVLASCTYEKGEVAAPVQDCVADSTIDVIPVSIGDNFFSPTDITIVAGDSVKWTMTNNVPHTTTCDGTNGSTLPSGGTTWDSGVLMNPGDQYTKAITVPGNYHYICVVHGVSMAGTIVVKPRCH